MAEWRGMKVKLNSPSPIRKGEPGYGRKKSKVFVMKNGKVNKIMFGDPNMKIRKNNPKARASFRARHKCSTAKDKTTARYWSCRAWQRKETMAERKVCSNKGCEKKFMAKDNRKKYCSTQCSQKSRHKKYKQKKVHVTDDSKSWRTLSRVC